MNPPCMCTSCTSLHFNYLLKVAYIWYEAGSRGSKQDTALLRICIHKTAINYVNDQENSTCFFLIILFILTINSL